MEAVEKIKSLIIDLDINEMGELKHWLLSEGANVFGVHDLSEAAEERGYNCPLDHVDDLTDGDIARMAVRIGMLEPDDDAVNRIADAVAEGRTRDALDMLKDQFGGPEPKTQLFLTDIRGRAIA